MHSRPSLGTVQLLLLSFVGFVTWLHFLCDFISCSCVVWGPKTLILGSKILFWICCFHKIWVWGSKNCILKFNVPHPNKPNQQTNFQPNLSPAIYPLAQTDKNGSHCMFLDYWWIEYFETKSNRIRLLITPIHPFFWYSLSSFQILFNKN